VAGVYSFGASRNHVGGAESLALWAPRFAEVLGERLGTQVSLHVAEDYERLLHAVEYGAVQVSWLPPLLQSRAEAAGARLVAVTQRGGRLTYRSAVLVRRDGRFPDARSLRGARAAWLDPFSASGYVFPRLELVALGATFSSETFHGSLASAFDAVARGEADVCACFVGNPTPEDPGRAAADAARTAGPHASELRIVHVTGPIPGDAIAVSRGVPDASCAAIADSLVHLHESGPGLEVIREMLHADCFVRITPEVRAQLGLAAG